MTIQTPEMRAIAPRAAQRAQARAVYAQDFPTQQDTATSRGGCEVVMAKSGVLVLSGYGLRIAIERGQLAVADGISHQRRTGRFSRATCGLKRLVILGHSGTISLEALRWLDDLGASITQIDADGNVLLASGPAGTNEARLRRAQALAPWTGMGMLIARELLRHKLEGQMRVLDQELGAAAEASDAIRQELVSLEDADDPERLRLVEARAAAVYWRAWASMPVRFARKDERAVSEHWSSFGSRTSPLTGSPRRAANPANALLNYLYAIVEAEARIALVAVGLDPAMGVLHADQRNRDSLACDLMEAVRPEVDALVLDLLQTRTFAAKDFFETRQGDCRLLSPMTQLLAETAPRWAKAVAPLAEWAERTLAESFGEGVALMEQRRRLGSPLSASAQTTQRNGPVPTSSSSKQQVSLPTPLTQSNRSAGRERHRRRPASVGVHTTPEGAAMLPPTCRTCGVLLADSDHTYCPSCRTERHVELYPTFIASGLGTLADLRAAGVDPAHGGEAAQKRGKRLLEQLRADQEWKATQAGGTNMLDGDDLLDYVRDVLPHLQGLSLGILMQATGLSRRHCWRIRRGEVVPHPRHWQTLRELRR